MVDSYLPLAALLAQGGPTSAPAANGALPSLYAGTIEKRKDARAQMAEAAALRHKGAAQGLGVGGGIAAGASNFLDGLESGLQTKQAREALEHASEADAKSNAAFDAKQHDLDLQDAAQAIAAQSVAQAQQVPQALGPTGMPQQAAMMQAAALQQNPPPGMGMPIAPPTTPRGY